MKWAIGVLLTLGLAAAIFWGYASFSSTTVVLAAPERREAVKAVFATGSVRAEQIAHLRPELGGEVMLVGVRQGEEVRQGTKVLEISVREEQQAVTEQQSRVREAGVAVQSARENYEREQALLQQGATTQQAVDDMKAALDRAAAAAQTTSASLAVRKTRSDKGVIEAPITGVVTRVNVSVGDVIAPNTEAITILDPSSFKIFADIDELDINRVRPGQEAIVAFDAMPSRRFRARVERVIPQADEIAKTLPVILNLIDNVPNLSDGLTATVNIIQERRSNALTIPTLAVLETDDTSIVIFVVDDYSKLQRRRVKPGIRGEDYVEVLEGLREDERVALNPEATWNSGDVVEVDRKRMRENIR